MRILVYGAGNIGSLYAGLLAESGQEISILARGERLARIRERGIELLEAATGQEKQASVDAIERLDSDEAYDLILVVLPRQRVPEVLPALAANRSTPSVMFMGNNASGPQRIVEAVGPDRTLLGFPGAAGFTESGRIRYLICSAREQPTTIGELEGRRSARIREIAAAFEQAGFPIAVCSNMDAWLKTHAAEVSPTANAVYMAAGDYRRLARTRDCLVLMLRAIREGYRVLGRLGVPITPANHRLFQWLPEPLLVALMRRMVASESTAIKIGHAHQARDEWRVIADELHALAARAQISTPAFDRLCRYLDPTVAPATDGSAEIPLRWRPHRLRAARAPGG